MDTDPKVPGEFRTWLKSFLDNQVDFLLVGGYAVGLHGYARFTNDIDFWVEPDPANTSKIMRAAELIGFPLRADAVLRLSVEKSVIRVGPPPFRVDVMTSCDGCNWADAWKRRVVTEIDGLKVPVISLEDLKAAKRAAGRYKDLDDLENLPDESLI